MARGSVAETINVAARGKGPRMCRQKGTGAFMVIPWPVTG